MEITGFSQCADDRSDLSLLNEDMCVQESRYTLSEVQTELLVELYLDRTSADQGQGVLKYCIAAPSQVPVRRHLEE